MWKRIIEHIFKISYDSSLRFEQICKKRKKDLGVSPHKKKLPVLLIITGQNWHLVMAGVWGLKDGG